MPADYPRRHRIRLIIIVILLRWTSLGGNDGTVEYRLTDQLARVQKMFKDESDTSIGASDELSAVDTAYGTLADYVEQNEKTLNTDTLEGLMDALSDALDLTDY